MSSPAPADGPLFVTFWGGNSGEWVIDRTEAVSGPLLAPAARLAIALGKREPPPGEICWTLRGVTSHARYTTTPEAVELSSRQPPLSRAEATCAALIPIRKKPQWWGLAQDERRAIYQERSRHTSIGLEYLPRIARRLHHCRDLGEPFDFLTWFEFAPEHESAFNELLARLRASEEWRYVDREVDIRLRQSK